MMVYRKQLQPEYTPEINPARSYHTTVDESPFSAAISENKHVLAAQSSFCENNTFYRMHEMMLFRTV